MKFTFLTLVLFIFFSSEESSANWLCRVAASERNGDIINSCGVAEAPTETEARANARKAAFEELNSICSQSPDCANFEYTIKPLRTDCEKTSSGFKCYRGIEATISDVPRDPSRPRQGSEEILVPVKKTIIQDDLLAGKIERTVVSFNSTPQGAIVYVDGIQICETPCSREVQLGKHLISIEKNNYSKYASQVNVTKQFSDVNVQLANLFGYLDLTELPENSVIKIDDLQVDPSKIKLSPGKHILTVEHSHYQPFSREIEIKKGVTSKLHNVLEPLIGFIVISAADKSGNALKAKIFIDGHPTNEVTPAKLKVAAGKRKIELIAPQSLYASATREINSDTVYNLNFVLGKGQVRPMKPVSKNTGFLGKFLEKPDECNSNNDCAEGFQCATIRGEYPGTCVKSGLGF